MKKIKLKFKDCVLDLVSVYFEDFHEEVDYRESSAGDINYYSTFIDDRVYFEFKDETGITIDRFIESELVSKMKDEFADKLIDLLAKRIDSFSSLTLFEFIDKLEDMETFDEIVQFIS